jgi:hypothetical protein
MRIPNRILFVMFAVGLATAQQPAPSKASGVDDEIAKVAAKDPYTGGDPAAMAAAGVVAYAPFTWADGNSTEKLDTVLGERRILWMETAHFRIGLSLRSIPISEDQRKRRALLEELAALHRRLPKAPEKPKRLDPWLRLHLYAQRLESLYAEFSTVLGLREEDFPEGSKFLGLPDKFLVLLFAKKSDLARYSDRFCGLREDTTLRHYHPKSHQLVAALASEGLENFDEAGQHGLMLYMVAHNLLNGYNGFHYQMPLWLDEGLAHWFSRKIETDTVNVQILDSEAVAEDKQANWPVKVRRRAQHAGVLFPYAVVAGWQKFEEMGYHAHAQAWSRVDFLIARDRQKFGAMVRKLKGLGPVMNGMRTPEELTRLCEEALQGDCGLSPDRFDQEWREWVLKTYPKK